MFFGNSLVGMRQSDSNLRFVAIFSFVVGGAGIIFILVAKIRWGHLLDSVASQKQATVTPFLVQMIKALLYWLVLGLCLQLIWLSLSALRYLKRHVKNTEQNSPENHKNPS
jgi:hypothetical protein